MISCNNYDYIEIACTYKYVIKLTMKSGRVVTCIAIDTALNLNKEECIKVDINGNTSLIVLDDIAGLEACAENPHFSSIVFT